MKALVAQLFVVSVVKSYGETDEFFVVSGSFGDAWKDKVLIGEYKRLDRYIDGAIALQKRNGDDFFLRYHAQDQAWYWQTKAYLNSRTNFAHLKCSRKTTTPAECFNQALKTCSVWTAKNKWETCKNIRITEGGQSLRNKHRYETQKTEEFNRLKDHPQFINVDGSFGDRWKDSVLPGMYKIDPSIKVPGLAGRPVYKKADNTDFYLNYYERTKEWGFRSKKALGEWRNYAYLRGAIATKNPIQITQTEYTCYVFAEHQPKQYKWRECVKSNGKYEFQITGKQGLVDSAALDMIESNGNEFHILPKRPIPTARPTSGRGKRPTMRPMRIRTTKAPTTEVIYTMMMQKPPPFTKITAAANFKDAIAFCDDTSGRWKTRLAYYVLTEPGLDQKWLRTYKPWVNIQKTNSGWKSPNGEDVFVFETNISHKCAVYDQNMIMSEDCNYEHAMICQLLED